MAKNTEGVMIAKPHRTKVKKATSDYVIVVLMVVIVSVVAITTLFPFLNALAISGRETGW